MTSCMLTPPSPSAEKILSHISVEFLTGLPVSEGKTTILTIVDCFTKTVHFVALPKHPSAKKTAETLVNDVFRFHGIPQDTVSEALSLQLILGWSFASSWESLLWVSFLVKRSDRGLLGVRDWALVPLLPGAFLLDLKSCLGQVCS